MMYPIDFFFRAAQRYPDRVALLGPAEQRVSFSELAKRVRALAAAMQAQDPCEQSRVAICAGNHAAHVVALLATLAAGKVWVPLNVRSTAVEIDRIIKAVAPSILITDDKGQELTGASTTANTEGNSTVMARWSMQAADLPSIDSVSALHHDKPLGCITTGRDATQAIKFTGGTTGAPKGVMQPYRAWNACIINQIHGWNLTPDDRYVVCAPVTHGTSTYIVPVLAQGGCLVFPEQNNPAGIASAFSEYKGTISFMPPTLIYMLMSDPAVKAEDFASLRHLVFGGAPMPPEKVDRAISFFGPRMAATYGQTESPQIVV